MLQGNNASHKFAQAHISHLQLWQCRRFQKKLIKKDGKNPTTLQTGASRVSDSFSFTIQENVYIREGEDFLTLPPLTQFSQKICQTHLKSPIYLPPQRAFQDLAQFSVVPAFSPPMNVDFQAVEIVPRHRFLSTLTTMPYQRPITTPASILNLAETGSFRVLRKIDDDFTAPQAANLDGVCSAPSATPAVLAR